MTHDNKCAQMWWMFRLYTLIALSGSLIAPMELRLASDPPFLPSFRLPSPVGLSAARDFASSLSFVQLKSGMGILTVGAGAGGDSLGASAGVVYLYIGEVGKQGDQHLNWRIAGEVKPTTSNNIGFGTSVSTSLIASDCDHDLLVLLIGAPASASDAGAVFEYHMQVPRQKSLQLEWGLADITQRAVNSAYHKLPLNSRGVRYGTSVSLQSDALAAAVAIQHENATELYSRRTVLDEFTWEARLVLTDDTNYISPSVHIPLWYQRGAMDQLQAAASASVPDPTDMKVRISPSHHHVAIPDRIVLLPAASRDHGIAGVVIPAFRYCNISSAFPILPRVTTNYELDFTGTQAGAGPDTVCRWAVFEGVGGSIRAPNSDRYRQDWFGFAMAIDGRTLAVSSPVTSSVHVFSSALAWRTMVGGNGTVWSIAVLEWKFRSSIMAPVRTSSFGWALVLSSSRLLVGTPDGKPDADGVYVYDNALPSYSGEWKLVRRFSPSGRTETGQYLLALWDAEQANPSHTVQPEYVVFSATDVLDSRGSLGITYNVLGGSSLLVPDWDVTRELDGSAFGATVITSGWPNSTSVVIAASDRTMQRPVVPYQDPVEGAVYLYDMVRGNASGTIALMHPLQQQAANRGLTADARSALQLQDGAVNGPSNVSSSLILTAVFPTPQDLLRKHFQDTHTLSSGHVNVLARSGLSLALDRAENTLVINTCCSRGVADVNKGVTVYRRSASASDTAPPPPYSMNPTTRRFTLGFDLPRWELIQFLNTTRTAPRAALAGQQGVSLGYGTATALSDDAQVLVVGGPLNDGIEQLSLGNGFVDIYWTVEHFQRYEMAVPAGSEVYPFNGPYRLFQRLECPDIPVMQPKAAFGVSVNVFGKGAIVAVGCSWCHARDRDRIPSHRLAGVVFLFGFEPAVGKYVLQDVVQSASARTAAQYGQNMELMAFSKLRAWEADSSWAFCALKDRFTRAFGERLGTWLPSNPELLNGLHTVYYLVYSSLATLCETLDPRLAWKELSSQQRELLLQDWLVVGVISSPNRAVQLLIDAGQADVVVSMLDPVFVGFHAPVQTSADLATQVAIEANWRPKEPGSLSSRPATLHHQDAAVTSNAPARGERFGWKAQLMGRVMIVAAVRDSKSLAFEPGAVIVFERHKFFAEWVMLAQARSPLPSDGDRFGYGLHLRGLQIFAGAPRSTSPRRRIGSVSVFRLSETYVGVEGRQDAAGTSSDPLDSLDNALAAVCSQRVGNQGSLIDNYAYTVRLGAGTFTWSTYPLGCELSIRMVADDPAATTVEVTHPIRIASGSFSATGIHFSRNASAKAACDALRSSSVVNASASNQTMQAGHMFSMITANVGTDEVLFQRCWFTHGCSISDSGGALSLRSDQVHLDNCLFINNTASLGGAIYIQGSKVVMTHCQLEYNHALELTGGAVHMNGGTLDMTSSTVAHCTATLGGGAIAERVNAVLVIRASSIRNCSSSLASGGAVDAEASSVVATGLQCVGNVAFQTGGCAAIRLSSQREIRIQHSSLTFNSAGTLRSSLEDSGRALVASGLPPPSLLAAGGAVFVADSSKNVTVVSSELAYNSAGLLGGGIAVADGALTHVQNCSLHHNQALAGPGGGLAVVSKGSSGSELGALSLAVVLQSRISHNSARFGGGGVASVVSSLLVVETELDSNFATDSGSDTSDTAIGGGLYASLVDSQTVEWSDVDAFVDRAERETISRLLNQHQRDSDTNTTMLLHPLQAITSRWQAVNRLLLVRSTLQNNTASFGAATGVVTLPPDKSECAVWLGEHRSKNQHPNASLLVTTTVTNTDCVSAFVSAFFLETRFRGNRAFQAGESMYWVGSLPYIRQGTTVQQLPIEIDESTTVASLTSSKDIVGSPARFAIVHFDPVLSTQEMWSLSVQTVDAFGNLSPRWGPASAELEFFNVSKKVYEFTPAPDYTPDAGSPIQFSGLRARARLNTPAVAIRLAIQSAFSSVRQLTLRLFVTVAPCKPNFMPNVGLDGEASDCLPCSIAAVSDGINPCTLCSEIDPASIPGANGLCAKCPAGMQPSEDSSICVPCPPGQYRPEAANKTCMPCPAGTFSEDLGSAVCQPCDAGTSQPGVGQRVCEPCGNGRYSDPGATTCQLCSSAALRCQGLEFSVVEGFWWAANAKSNVSALWSPESLLSRTQYQCVQPAHCIPERTLMNASYSVDHVAVQRLVSVFSVTCAPGHEGVICNLCAPMHAKLGDSCVRCWSTALNVVFFVVLCIIMIVAAVVYIARRDHVLDTEEEDAQPATDTDVVTRIRILVNYLQVLALISSFRARGPQLVATIVAIGSSAGDGLSLDLFPLKCLFQLTYWDTVIGYLCMPPFVAVFTAAIVGSRQALAHRCGRVCCIRKGSNHAVVRRSSATNARVIEVDLWSSGVDSATPKVNSEPRPPSAKKQNVVWRRFVRLLCGIPHLRGFDAWLTVFIAIFFLMYIRIVTTMFRVFQQHTDDIDGKTYMAVDMSIEAAGPQYVMLSILAAAGLIGYGFLAPTLAAYSLWKNAARLQTPEMQARWGFLYAGYRLDGGYWWEFVVLGRKIVLLCIVSVVTDSNTQSVAGSLAIVAALTAHNIAQPFEHWLHNALETATLFAVFATIALSLLYESQPASEGAITACLLLGNFIVVSLCIIAIVISWKNKRAMKQKCRFRTPAVVSHAPAKLSTQGTAKASPSASLWAGLSIQNPLRSRQMS